MSGTVVPWSGDPNVMAVLQPRRQRSRLTIIAMVGLGLALLLVGVLLLVIGEPLPLLVSTVAAAVSFPLLIWFYFWLDRWEPEPTRYRWAALVWGGSAAVLIGAGSPVRDRGVHPLRVLARGRRSHRSPRSSPRVCSWCWWSGCGGPSCTGWWTGIVYAGLAGIGFAFTEDIVYYSSAFTDGGPTDLAALVIVRGIFSPFAHSLFTAAIGIGIGVAVTARSREARVLAPLLGYLVAVLLHAIWNGSTMVADGRGFLIAYVVVMLPALAVLVVLATRARQQEGLIVERSLVDCARRGWVTPVTWRWPALAARRTARRAASPRRWSCRAADGDLPGRADRTGVPARHGDDVTATAGGEAGPAGRGPDIRTQILRPYALPSERPDRSRSWSPRARALVGGPLGQQIGISRSVFIW